VITFAKTHSDARSSDEGGAALVEGAGEIVELAREYLAHAGEILRDVIKNRPELALGAALAAGVVLGWLIKRR